MGSLVTALASFLDARVNGGIWMLRIDDIDPLRDDPQAKRDFGPVLAAHGLIPDKPIWYQSDRFEHYRTYLGRLDTYPCACSRKQIQARGGEHGGNCHSPPASPARRWRVNNELLWRRDDLPTYHLACAADEIDMHITHVVRGEDLGFAAPIQSALIRAWGHTAPAYQTIPLVRAANGQKLSKQNLAPALSLENASDQLDQALGFLFPSQAFNGTIAERLEAAQRSWSECAT